MWNLISVKARGSVTMSGKIYAVKPHQFDICRTSYQSRKRLSDHIRKIYRDKPVWYLWNLISVKQEAEWPHQVKYTQANLFSVIYVEPDISQTRGWVTTSGKIYTGNLISVIYVEPHISQARGWMTISGKIYTGNIISAILWGTSY